MANFPPTLAENALTKALDSFVN